MQLPNPSKYKIFFLAYWKTILLAFVLWFLFVYISLVENDEKERFNQLSNIINNTNDTYRQDIVAYLTYLTSTQTTLSHQVNLTSEDSLRRITALEEQIGILSNQLTIYNHTLENLTKYITTMPLNNTYVTVVYNAANATNKTEEPVTLAPVSCRQALMDKYGLGSYFDVVYCCESRTTGYADECCSCYR